MKRLNMYEIIYWYGSITHSCKAFAENERKAIEIFKKSEYKDREIVKVKIAG